jgi:choline oxidase
MSRTSDYIVVGGGTAGSIIARRLADAGADVTLVDQGADGEHDGMVLELPRFVEVMLSGWVRYLPVVPQPRGNSQLMHSIMLALGGCSSHNGCAAFMASDHDLEEWESLGAIGWGPVDSRPYFARVLERVHLEPSDSGNACQQAFIDAASLCGFPVVTLNDPNLLRGVGWLELNRRGRIRQSSAVAYLFPLSSLPANLRILTRTRAERIILDQSGRAVGVETSAGPLRAEREVILCGGALASPQLLMLSGIGPSEHLQSVGIDAVVDLPGVGENFRDHPCGTVRWASTRPVPQEGFHLESALFAPLGDNTAYPDLELMFMTALAPANEPGQVPEEAFSVHPNVTKARSTGTVRLLSADPAEPPLLDPRYFTDPDGYDERVIVEGVKLAREIAQQPALAEWIEREVFPGPEVDGDEALSAFIRSTHLTAFHPAGTCRMGADDDSLAVVDSQLRVRGVDRLRVADASVFPTLPGNNPNLTVMMVGERCADFALGHTGAELADARTAGP